MSKNDGNAFDFANTLANYSGESHMMNDCERFGMTWGCRPDCPVFEKGKCELQEENTVLFKKEGLIDE
jgi:hypothetical protein